MNSEQNIIDGELTRIVAVLSTATENALAQIGRTEDIRFSPDNRRLAIAGFLNQACYIFDIEIDCSKSAPIVRVGDYVELRSDTMNLPHGLDFIDENTLVVAKREGNVEIFEIPQSGGMDRVFNLNPIRTINKSGFFGKIRSPGSVCTVSEGKDRVELLVCNNYKHRVSSHVFGLGPNFCLPRNRIILESGLAIPDGIAVSPDKSWIAISNHQDHSILLYDASKRLNRKTRPSGVLSGVNYPHGIRFSSDGCRLFVSDAGARYVHRFEAPGGDWRGNRESTSAVSILDEETFLRGHTNPLEGGAKGLDIDASNQVMAVTCGEQPLSFFNIQKSFGLAE